jgi:hypothetical protein
VDADRISSHSHTETAVWVSKFGGRGENWEENEKTPELIFICFFASAWAQCCLLSMKCSNVKLTGWRCFVLYLPSHCITSEKLVKCIICFC